jgi:hypothetical protein
VDGHDGLDTMMLRLRYQLPTASDDRAPYGGMDHYGVPKATVTTKYHMTGTPNIKHKDTHLNFGGQGYGM